MGFSAMEEMLQLYELQISVDDLSTAEAAQSTNVEMERELH